MKKFIFKYFLIYYFLWLVFFCVFLMNLCHSNINYIIYFLESFIFLIGVIAFGFPLWLSGKELDCQCRWFRFIPWWRRLLEEGNGNPPLYLPWKSCDRGAWWATFKVAKESDTLVTKQQQYAQCGFSFCYTAEGIGSSKQIIPFLLGPHPKILCL